MSYDDDWPDNTTENQRLMFKKTMRSVSLDELKKLGEVRFPVVTDPWCERYHEFLDKHATARFYLGEIPGGVEVVYCPDVGKAIWFLPGMGMGVVQPKGLAMLREIVDSI